MNGPTRGMSFGLNDDAVLDRRRVSSSRIFRSGIELIRQETVTTPASASAAAAGESIFSHARTRECRRLAAAAFALGALSMNVKAPVL
jgi:hypothetical protein